MPLNDFKRLVFPFLTLVLLDSYIYCLKHVLHQLIEFDKIFLIDSWLIQ